MQFGMPGTINSHVSSQGICVMAPSRKSPDTASDAVWDDIFNNLTIDNEPPTRYIKSVVIQTKDGSLIKVSGKHFAEIIEQERHLDPNDSEIRSCKMSINFPRLRADVESWTGTLFSQLDADESFRVLVKTKKRRIARKKTQD